MLIVRHLNIFAIVQKVLGLYQDTDGLMVFTDDGFLNSSLREGHGDVARSVSKTYHVEVSGLVWTPADESWFQRLSTAKATGGCIGENDEGRCVAVVPEPVQAPVKGVLVRSRTAQAQLEALRWPLTY